MSLHRRLVLLHAVLVVLGGFEAYGICAPKGYTTMLVTLLAFIAWCGGVVASETLEVYREIRRQAADRAVASAAPLHR